MNVEIDIGCDTKTSNEEDKIDDNLGRDCEIDSNLSE